MDRIMTEQTENTMDFNQVLGMYEQRLQEQTAIIFAMVGKAGGEILLTQEDLVANPEFNTVAAKDADGGGVIFSLTYESQDNQKEEE